MKYIIGFVAGSAVAASVMMAVNPMDMRKVKRKCRNAKRMMKEFI